MSDNLSQEQRGYCMSRIRCRDTEPEQAVRRFLHAQGLRFRLHRRDLPGCPDIVLSASRQVVFVHGCFWHSHSCKRGNVRAATRGAYWEAKRTGTIERDRRVATLLRRQGWRVSVIWECWTENPAVLERRLGLVVRRAGAVGSTLPTKN